jgi:holo-[acyl-carrier protein] synthase
MFKNTSNTFVPFCREIGLCAPIGTDIVEVDKIGKLIKKFGDIFLRKIFSEWEIAQCTGATATRRFAARFAAKEAFSKAIGTGIGRSVGWKDVSVGKKISGEPYIILSEKAKAVVQSLGFSGARVSISHTKTIAHAVVALS